LPEVETTSFITSSDIDLDCADLNQEIDLSTRLEELEFVNIDSWLADWEGPDGLNIQDDMEISVNQSGPII